MTFSNISPFNERSHPSPISSRILQLMETDDSLVMPLAVRWEMEHELQLISFVLPYLSTLAAITLQ